MVQQIYLNPSINFSAPIFLYQACLSPSVSPSNLPSQADLCQTYLILLLNLTLPSFSFHFPPKNLSPRGFPGLTLLYFAPLAGIHSAAQRRPEHWSAPGPCIRTRIDLCKSHWKEVSFIYCTIYHMYHIHISFVSFDIWFNRIWNHWNVDGIWKRLKSVASITIWPFAKVLTAMSCRFYKRFPRVGTQASQVTQVDPAMISKYRLQETTLWNPWYLVVDVLISVSQKRAVYSWFQTSVYI